MSTTLVRPTTTAVSNGETGQPPSPRFILRFTVPMALLALTGSLVGILVDTTYSRETENWAAQAIAQDLVNLLAFSSMVILAILAARGSLRAYLAWLGVVAYSAYTYAIYAFALHFGPLFLVHVAVFGLSIYALIVGVMLIDSELLKRAFTAGVPRRFTASLVLAIGAFFYLLWLSSVVPPLLAGDTPEEVVDAGLLTNPVHVLDMAVLLPAMLLAGVCLMRQRAIGYLLAPVVLGATFTISLGIVVIQPVLDARGETPAWGVGGVIAIVAFIELAALIRFLRALPQQVILSSVLRRPLRT